MKRKGWMVGAMVIFGVLASDAGHAGPGREAVDAKRWASGLPDGVSLGRISIPGTHDSAALHEPLRGTAACQDVGIGKQLDFGVRYLDIRCRHVGDRFAIHHGAVFQKLFFDDVLRDVYAFLDANPGECVIMAVKEEYKPKGNTRSFGETFDAYVAKNRKKWWLGDKVPRLGEVRGRIVLVRRFAADGRKGIDATRWPDNAAFEAGRIVVQDRYIVRDAAVKWKQVEKALDAAFADKGVGRLHINHASGYISGRFGIPDIPGVSDVVNPKLRAYFAAVPRGNYGCVVMDHATARLARLVFETNFTVSRRGRVFRGASDGGLRGRR